MSEKQRLRAKLYQIRLAQIERQLLDAVTKRDKNLNENGSIDTHRKKFAYEQADQVVKELEKKAESARRGLAKVLAGAPEPAKAE